MQQEEQCYCLYNASAEDANTADAVIDRRVMTASEARCLNACLRTQESVYRWVDVRELQAAPQIP